MNRVQKFALLYIMMMAVALYAYSVGRFKIFPYRHIEPFVTDYEKFAQGDVFEKKSSAVEKIKNDLGISFDRWIYQVPKIAYEHAIPVQHPTLSNRTEYPLLYIRPDHRTGYRVVIGAFNLRKSFWGGC